MRRLSLTLVPLLLVACTDQDPLAPATSPQFAVAGPHKEPISGFMDFAGAGVPAYQHETPSGICHVWNYPIYGSYHGDVVGTVVFYEDQNRRCDGTGRLVARGPFEGEVTWNGRDGTMSGMWTTNCEPDPSLPPPSLSCDGTMNARGSGGLEGVHFHFKWGPGWWPFPYTGKALFK